MALFSSKYEAFNQCFSICVFEYCMDLDGLGQPSDVGYPFLLGAAAVYQSLVGELTREKAWQDAKLQLDAFSSNLAAPHEAFVNARFSFLRRSFTELKTGVFAGMKTRAVLENYSPQILTAIEKCNPNLLPRPSFERDMSNYSKNRQPYT
jgi:hypothetical protein